MKNLRNLSLTTLLFIFVSPLNAYFFGCDANDPGECSAECHDGSPCCVGTKSNCSEDPFNNPPNWINCGEGSMFCGEIPTT